MRLNDSWVSWEEVLQLISGKRVIFFGSGEWVEKTLPYLNTKGDYIVDNNPYEHGQSLRGLAIRKPEILKKENPDEIIIIITTTGFQEVSEQLIGYGLMPGRHFIVSPSLKNYYAISRINNHDCTLLLTCSDQPNEVETRGGGLYSFQIGKNKLEKIISGNCHGLVDGPGCLYLVDDTVGVRVLNRKLEEQLTFPLPEKSRPHGIAYSPEKNLIMVVLSGRDSVGFFDAQNYKLIDELHISDKWKHTSIAQHHLNDLCVNGNSIYLSMISSSGNWKRGVYDGAVIEIAMDNRKILGPVVSDLWFPHSPTMIKGNLCYCDSNKGIVYNSTWKIISKFNGFVRGIAHDGEFYYVGQSMHRYIDRLQGASDNISLDSGIFIIDESSKATKFFSIPQLTDIKTVAYMPDIEKALNGNI